MAVLEPGTDDWLAQVKEEIIEPERPIIDPHHHIWKKRFNRNYLLPELWADTGSGHNVVKTVFMECHAFYLREGPDHLRPLGETDFILETAKQSREDDQQATIAGIVAHADLTLAGERKGEGEDKLREILDAHADKCAGLFKGIRHGAAWDKRPEDLLILNNAPQYLFGKESFRRGLRILAERGLTFDSWHYHHQNLDFIELARAIPECTMILDHFGTPLGVGIYKGRRDEIFKQWKADIIELAKCKNVYAKLGGLAMPDNGFPWHQAERPPTSDEFITVQEGYYKHAIECFGPERCMFESNFPVDRLSINYHTLFNAYKKMVYDFTEDEKHAMFYGTAEKVYSLQD